METIYYSIMHTPVGPITVWCSEKGLMRLERRPITPEKKKFHFLESNEKTRQVVRELEEYFAGKRKKFTVPLDLRGTEFQRQCWAALQRIPYGETRSYGDIAREVGKPHAFRAVGMANHSNPVSIIVPCHRVIASNGGLCGYGGGLPMKQFLLDLERGTPTLYT